MRPGLQWFGVWAAVMCLCPNTVAAGRQNAPAGFPDFIVVSGTTVDESGKPVPGARITMATVGNQRFDYTQIILHVPVTYGTESDAGGHFQLSMPWNEPRKWGQARLLLMVHADGFATRIVDMTVDRLLVDLPFVLTMSRATPVRVWVQDANGGPLRGATVRKGVVENGVLPFLLEPNQPVTTNNDGFAVLNDADIGTLASVYIESPSTGNQLVKLQAATDCMIARLKPGGTVRGRITLPDDVDANQFRFERNLVVSVSHRDFSRRMLDSLSWQWLEIEEGNSFVAEGLTSGLVQFRWGVADQLPIAIPTRLLAKLDNLELADVTSGLELNVAFEKARVWEFRVVDEQDIPVPGIEVSSTQGYSGERMTNGLGGISLFVPESEKLAGQLFVHDPLNEFRLRSLMGIDLDRLVPGADGEPATISLMRNAFLKGNALDDKGAPIAGAAVEVEQEVGQFRVTTRTWSDRRGEILIRGLAPDCIAKVSGRQGSLVFDETEIDVPVPEGKTLRLQAIRRAVAAPIGRVVDPDGHPVGNVNVTLLRTTVVVPEGETEEMTRDVDYFPFDDPMIRTDSNGWFRFPEIADYQERFALKFVADGYFDLRIPFVSGHRLDTSDSLLHMGTFTLVPIPERRRVVITCLNDITAEPVADAQLAFVGYRAGRARAITEETGSTLVTLADCPQVVAVQARGFAVRYEMIRGVTKADAESGIVIRLQPQTPDAVPWRSDWYSRTMDSYRKQGRSLLDELGLPDVDAPRYRQSSYFDALAAINFPKLVSVLGDDSSLYVDRETHLQNGLYEAVFYPDAGVIAEIGSREMSEAARINLLDLAARSSRDPALRRELNARALISLEELTGDMKMMAAGRLARSLVADGHVRQAQEVLLGVWVPSTGFHQAIVDGTPIQGIGLSRRFAPLLGMLNFESARKFIALSAIQQEVGELEDTALMWLSTVDWDAFERIRAERTTPFVCRLNDMLGWRSELVAPSMEWIAWARKMCEAVPDTIECLRLELIIARTMQPGTERSNRVEGAASTWRKCELSGMWHGATEPGFQVLDELALFKDISREELDMLVFESMQKDSGEFATYNTLTVLANVGKMLSLRDPALGRFLMEPVFKECSWLIHENGQYRFENNFILGAAGWIDPAWAADLAREKAAQFALDDPIRRQQMYLGVIRGFPRIR